MLHLFIFLFSETTAKSNVIRVSNLNNDNTEAELAELFTQFGIVQHINLVKDKKNNGQVQGDIHFSNKEDAKRAIGEIKELKNLDDTILQVELLEELDNSGN